MFDADQYQLLDFGGGRKLERFGAYLLDRYSPPAEDARKSNAAAWKDLHARYERTQGDEGRWKPAGVLPATWTISHGECVFELQATPFGHLGVFPEQAANWDWIAKQIARASRPLRVLNLFAYTGGSTLATAASGAEVVHVDSAKNTVAWARRNAELSGLAEKPIRWIAEDAKRFAERELRRGNRYDAVILDPPSYGHGPKGETWKITRDLHSLLTTCAALTEGQRAFMLLTCHSPGFEPPEVEAMLADAVFGTCQAGATAQPLTVGCVDGRQLPSGVVARWPR
ncbi:MAG: class I SAM-dependent methyltransferase [Planctomycetaceae bacterium]|nr:class I SAM-dependent methyltransferase [Planctomycetaceae bacterium]MCB9940747.1 class I SAM-dependent methyltransferase [Planctomycetaceae bacterium]HRX81408.1 class I SAM-dependent methyltransferase [Pirellulaceae bacterium]